MKSHKGNNTNDGVSRFSILFFLIPFSSGYLHGFEEIAGIAMALTGNCRDLYRIGFESILVVYYAAGLNYVVRMSAGTDSAL